MNNKEKLLARVENVFKQTQVVIDGIKLGERMQLKEMAEAVGVALGVEPKAVAHYVNDYAHNSDDGFVTRGKKGGFVKGARPAKVAKSQSNDSSADEVESVVESVTDVAV